MAAKKKAPHLVLVIFGVFFFLAGCIPGLSALKAVAFARATRSWSETTAIISSLELRHGGKKNSSLEVVATYRYRGPDLTSPEAGAIRDYTSERIGIHGGGSDNIGAWQQETFERLDQAKRAARAVPCWYNPADPTQAVLDRDQRWLLIGFLMIFPLMFGLFGGGMVAMGIHEWRKRGAAAADPRTLAGATMITADGGVTTMLWIVSVVWNLFAWSVPLVVFHGADVPLAVKLGMLIFPVVGLGFLFLTVIETVRVWRHGRPRLRLEQAAWLAGRLVQATVLMATDPGPNVRIDARLLVVRRVVSGSGKNRSVSELTLWSYMVLVDPAVGRLTGNGWEQLIELPLPSDLPTGEDDLTWTLEYQVIRPGPDLSATFTLPVAASDDGAVLYAAEQRKAADRAAPLAVLTRAGIRISEDRGAVVKGCQAGAIHGSTALVFL